MPPHSQREPDAEAVEDDERQYGHDPLSRQDLDSKYISPICRWKVAKFIYQGIKIALIITPRLVHSMT